MSLAIALLGATGSIGRSAVEVVRHHPERLRVATLAARGSDPQALAALARELAPRLVAVLEPAAAAALAGELPPGTELATGPGALVDAATHPEVERVVAAIVGAAGLPAVHAAVAAGKTVALANKEALVVAGRLLLELAERTGAVILPVDSEHSALHQALRCGAPREVRRLVLTASGGPFLRRDLATFGAITPEEALRHPTWSMGAKISIDSATLVNKGLELIEAAHLFAVSPEQLDVVIHPQSLVHSLVEWRDGSWIAQLSVNDMALPIQYALAFPERWDNGFARLEPTALRQLEFLPVEPRRYPAFALARHALTEGESAPAVFNAANEIAVQAFLDRRIPFSAIPELLGRVLDRHRAERLGSLDDALAWDAWSRARAAEVLPALAGFG